MINYYSKKAFSWQFNEFGTVLVYVQGEATQKSGHV